MKQYPTKKEWGELSKEEMELFWKNIEFKDRQTIEDNIEYAIPNIGQIIEYLGKGWYEKIDQDYFDNCSKISNQELCDLLWKAVKYKVKLK